jgi:regulatory protein
LELHNKHSNNPYLAEAGKIYADEEEALRYASACLRAEKAALRLIARAEQCVSGLTRKLQKRGHETACVNVVISRLMELDLVNDKHFAALWLESRLRLARSPQRLLAALCARGIDRDDAETALNTVLNEETELALLTRFVKKHRRKAGRNKKETDARSLKLFLKKEGFSPLIIQNFISGQ